MGFFKSDPKFRVIKRVNCNGSCIYVGQRREINLKSGGKIWKDIYTGEEDVVTSLIEDDYKRWLNDRTASEIVLKEYDYIDHQPSK